MTWTHVQSWAQAVTAGGTAVTASGPAVTAGNQCSIMLTNSGTGTWTLPAGWVQAKDPNGNPARALNSGNDGCEIWYLPPGSNPGGITSVLCTSSSSANLKAVLDEDHTDVASPVITVTATGTGVAGAVATCAVTTGTAPNAGDLVKCCFHQRFTAATAITWTSPSGFILSGSDTAAATHHQYAGYQLSAAGGAQTVTGKSSVAADSTTGWAGTVATFTAAPAGAGPGAGKVGCYMNPAIWGTGTTEAQAIANWQNLTSRTLTVRRVYYGTVPQSTSLTPDLRADAAAGRKVAFNFKPAYTPPAYSSADLATIDAFLSNCKAAGLNAIVSLYAEPYTSQTQDPKPGLMADFIGMWQFYAPTVRQYYPAIVNFGSFAVKSRNELSVFPGTNVDGVAVDYYCASWKGDGRPGTYTSASSLKMVADLADANSLPCGLYEFNASFSTNPANGQPYDSTADATGFFGYLQAFFTGRLAAGKVNGDIILFNSGGGASSLNSPVTTAADPRVALWQAMFDALNGGSVTAIALAGELDLTFTATGTLAAGAPLTGTLPLTFTATGNLVSTGQPFPAGPLPLKAEIQLAQDGWTDITAYVYQRDPVTVARGAPDESSQVSPSALGLTINNRDGRFSSRNPLGPWYGQFGKNTPIRVSALAGSAFTYRFWGEVASWPQQWDVTGTDVWVPLEAAGLLRRLQQGSPAPLRSAMTRYWQKLAGASAPVAYWPMEDGGAATQVASGLPGGTPLGISQASPHLASFTGFTCSAALPVLNGAQFQAALPAYTSSGDVVVTFLLSVPAAGDSFLCVPLAFATNGSIGASLQYTPGSGGQLVLLGFDSSGDLLFTTDALTGFEGTPVAVRVALRHSGAAADCSMQMLAPGGTVQSVSISVTAPSSLGTITDLVVNEIPTNSSGSLVTSSIGHVAVQSLYSGLPSLAQALSAWQGEAAGVRFKRLVGEEGLGFASRGNLADTVAMGPQQPLTLLSLLTECQQADRGMIYEPRTSLAVGYRTRVSIGNQVPAAALSYTAFQVAPGLSPADDDQHTANDVTVTRGTGPVTGSSYEAVLNDGSAMSVSQPPAGAGQYAAALTLNLAADSQCDDLANWILRSGTVNEPRYPVIPLNLRTAGIPASLLAQLAAMTIGDLLTVANTPAWLPPDGISQIVSGVAETLGPYQWSIAVNAIPATPWNTAYADDLVYGRADTDGSSLHADITSTSATMTADTVAGAPWVNTTLGRAGAYLDTTAMGVPDVPSAEVAWQAITSRALTVRHVYYAPSQATFTFSADLQADQAAGRKICFAFKPSFNPVSATELAAITAFLATCKAAGLMADVACWHEPLLSGLTSGQYIAMVGYYGPSIRRYYPLVFVTAATSAQASSENNWYPGDAAVDKVATDLYAGSYYTVGTRLDTAALTADNAVPPKPFGLWEYGSNPTANFLAGQNTGFEGGVGNWTGSGNCTSSGTSAQAHSGTQSLSMSSGAAGNMTAAHTSVANIATQGLRCVPGDQIVASAWLRTAVSARSAECGAQFYTSGGVLVSPGGSVYGATVTDSTSAWTQATATVTAPATAAYCRMSIQVLSAGAAAEVHYADDVIIYNATTLEFFTYVQGYFSTRAAAGKPNADLMWFNNTGGGGLSTVITSPSDYRVPALQAIFDALNGGDFPFDVEIGGERVTVWLVAGTASPQVLTVIRSVNGVIKAQAAGTDIRLFTTPAASL